MYQPDNFSAHEFVPQYIYNKYGSYSYTFMDDRILRISQALYNRYGTTYLNNYKWGGNRQWQGLRNDKSPDYSPTSQHTFGRACDFRFKNVTANEVREDLKDYGIGILKMPNSINSMRIEDDVSWLHVDCANIAPGIKFFKP